MALKVLIPATPSSVPYRDFTSDIECSVIPIQILPLSTPLIIIGSFLIKLPSVSYTVTAVPAVTDPLKNPVAPLRFPSINAGTDCVSDWFKLISVKLCTSNNERSHSSKAALDVS